MGGVVFGNKNGTKIKSPDLRQKAYDQYCKWLARGKSSRSFSFVEGDLICTGKTIESYIKDNTTEFPPAKREAAYAQGMAHWESVVDGTAEGSNKQACVPALNMLMRNKFGWDKEEKAEAEKASEQIQFAITKGKDLNGNNRAEPQTNNEPQRGNSQD